jgi:hypothetical protein
MANTPGIFCEHIKVGERPLFEDFNEQDGEQAETMPAFSCGLFEQPCRFATRKMQCPIYQEYLLDETGGPDYQDRDSSQ